MAHFWIQKTDETGRCWAALPVAGSQYRFVSTEPFVQSAGALFAAHDCARLLRVVRESIEHWLLVVSQDERLWVNGRLLLLGAHDLVDRDEIYLEGGQRMFFSTERLPQVVPFPGTDHEIYCARCRAPIEKGTPAVACPVCAAWCHQTEDLPCWRYEKSTHCPLCDQSNDSEVGFRWIPEGL